MRLLATVFFFWAFSVSSTAQDSRPATGSPTGLSRDRTDNGIWLDVPFFPQQKNGCGASSLAMIIQYWKAVPAVDPESIFKTLYSDRLKGILASRMKSYLEENGFQAFMFSGTLPDLKGHLVKGRPLIVSLGESSLHYVVVVGLDEPNKLVLLNDPAVKKLSKMDRQAFVAAWKSTNNWTLLAVPNARP